MSPYCGIVGALLSDLVSRWWLLYGERSKAPPVKFLAISRITSGIQINCYGLWYYFVALKWNTIFSRPSVPTCISLIPHSVKAIYCLIFHCCDIYEYAFLFNFCHCINIYSYWLGEQFRNLSLNRLYIASIFTPCVMESIYCSFTNSCTFY